MAQTKKSKVSVDTNVILRLLLEDVPSQTKAAEQLLTQAQSIEVADIAIVETIYVLEKVYSMPRQQIVLNIQGILQHEKINCNRILFNETLSLYETEPKLSITDCALLHYARLNKATPLYTFDKDLVKKSSEDAKQP